LSLTCWVLGATVIAGIAIVRGGGGGGGRHHHRQWPVHSSVY